MKPRLLAPLALLLVVSGCATTPNATTPDVTELRLPGLPWGSTTPEVTAVLVERGFQFVGRNGAGDLRFNDGELFGHDASLLARMHRDRLVKVVAYLEPHDPGEMEEEIDSIMKTLRRFYGPPSVKNDDDRGSVRSSPRPTSVGSTDSGPKPLAWLKNRPDGRTFGVMVRATPRPGYRIDFESSAWPEIYTIRGREGTLRDVTSISIEI